MTERMKEFAIATMIIALTMFAYSQQGNPQITERTDKEKKRMPLSRRRTKIRSRGRRATDRLLKVIHGKR
jgi:hypothetical protein